MLLDTLDIDELTTTGHASPQHTPGDQYLDNTTNTLYEYVQYDNGDAVAGAVGLPVGIVSATGSPFVVTADFSASETTSFRGVLRAIVGDLKYCWIARKGPTTALVDDAGAITIGKPLAWLADGKLDAATLGDGTGGFVVGHNLLAVGNNSTGSVLIGVDLL
jgi:hypothetical protein